MRHHSVAIKRSKILGIAIIIVLASIIVIAYAGNLLTTQPSNTIDFSVTLTNGTRVRIGEFKGNPVILVFFTTWCHQCREEVPELFKVYNSSTEKVTIIMVSVGLGGDSLSQIESFKTEFKIPWIIGLDEDKYYTQLGVDSVPYVFVLDSEGEPIHSNSGKVAGEELLNILYGIL